MMTPGVRPEETKSRVPGKTAVVMLRLWRDGTSFAWSKEEMPA